jgi:hypothetical protein
MSGTLCLNVLGYVMFDLLLYPYYYRWVGQERGGLSVTQIKNDDPPSRMSLNFCVEICGHLGMLLYVGSRYLLSSYRQAILTSTFLYVATVLPRIHHFLWEKRTWKLIVVVEIYQLLRRIVAACALRYFSQWANESLEGTIIFEVQDFVIHLDDDIAPFLIPLITMTIVRFVLAFLWYGPTLFVKPWVNALRQFKRNDKFLSQDNNVNMPLLVIIGIFCGLFQNIFLIKLQTKLEATENLEVAVRSGFYLWFFFLLPSASTDLWEGKPIALPMIEYSLHLVEICMLFVVNANYQKK